MPNPFAVGANTSGAPTSSKPAGSTETPTLNAATGGSVHAAAASASPPHATDRAHGEEHRHACA